MCKNKKIIVDITFGFVGIEAKRIDSYWYWKFWESSIAIPSMIGQNCLGFYYYIFLDYFTYSTTVRRAASGGVRKGPETIKPFHCLKEFSINNETGKD